MQLRELRSLLEKACVGILLVQLSGLPALAQQVAPAPRDATPTLRNTAAATAKPPAPPKPAKRKKPSDPILRAHPEPKPNPSVKLEHDLLELLLELTNPGHLLVGADDAATKEAKWKDLEAAFTKWKATTEKSFTKVASVVDAFPPKILFMSPAELSAFVAHQQLAVKSAALKVAEYAEKMQFLIQIRVLLGKSAWTSADGLRVPVRVVGRISGFDEIPGFDEVKAVRDVLSSRDSPIAVEFDGREGYDGEKTANVRIGEDIIESTVAQTRAKRPSEETFLKTTRFLIAASLYDRYEEIVDLRGRAAAPVPSIPKSLRDEIGDANRFKKIVQLQEQGRGETPLRKSLAQTFPLLVETRELIEKLPKTVKPAPETTQDTPELKAEALKSLADRQASEGWQFTTDALVQELVQISLKENEEADPGNIAVFRDHLVSAENGPGLMENLIQGISRFPFAYTRLDRPALQALLRRQIASAKYRSILPILAEIQFPKEKAEDVALAIEKAVTVYQAAIPEAAIDQWVEAAQKRAEEIGPSATRKQAIDDLIDLSTNLGAVMAAPIDKVPIDLETFHRAFEDELGGLAGSVTASELYELIFSASSIKLAYRALQKEREKLREDELCVVTPPDEALIRRRDQEALDRLAKFMGWDKKEAPSDQQTLGETDLNRDQKHKYRDMVESLTLSTSLLALKIDGSRLYEQIAQAHSRDEQERIIDRGAEKIEENLRARLTEIGDIDSKEQLERFLARSAFMDQLFKQRFPSLTQYVADIREKSLSGDQSRSEWRKVLDDYLMPMTLMMPLVVVGSARLVVRPTQPIIAGIARVSDLLMPEVAGYLETANLGFIGKIFGLLSWETYQRYRESELMERFFYTSVGPKSFYDYTSLTDATTAFKSARSELIFQGALFGLFWKAPIWAMQAKHAWLEAIDMGVAADLRTLKIENPSQMKWSDPEEAHRAVTLAAADRIGEITGGSIFSWDRVAEQQEIMAAMRRLLNRIDRQVAEAARFRREVGPLCERLGLAPKDAFDLDKISEAREKVENNYMEFKATERDVANARAAEDELTRIVVMESAYVNTGPIQKTISKVNRVRSWFKWDPIAMGSGREIRAQVYAEVYGFRAWSENRGPRGGGPDRRADLSEHYADILGITPDADLKTVKSAYRRLAMKYYPDRPGGDREKYDEVQKAYWFFDPPVQQERRNE